MPWQNVCFLCNRCKVSCQSNQTNLDFFSMLMRFTWTIFFGAIISIVVSALAASYFRAHELTPIISLVSALGFWVLALVGASIAIGWKKAFFAMSALGVFAFVIETIGLRTGFPYGQFEYGAALSLITMWGTPVAVFFSWSPLVIGVAGLLSNISVLPILRIVCCTVTLVLVDIVMDPGAVSLGFWRYMGEPLLDGVPLSNFAGWIVSGAIGSVIAYYFLPRNSLTGTQQLALSASLFLSLIFWIITALINGLWISVAVGIGLMCWLLAYLNNFNSAAYQM